MGRSGLHEGCKALSEHCFSDSRGRSGTQEFGLGFIFLAAILKFPKKMVVSSLQLSKVSYHWSI